MKARDLKFKILICLGIISWFVFGFGIYFQINAWFIAIAFLSGIGFFNWSGDVKERQKWNKGICRETNEPWEFDSSSMLSDLSITYCFKSGDYIYISQFITLETLNNGYKGNKNIE